MNNGGKISIIISGITLILTLIFNSDFWRIKLFGSRDINFFYHKQIYIDQYLGNVRLFPYLEINNEGEKSDYIENISFTLLKKDNPEFKKHFQVKSLIDDYNYDTDGNKMTQPFFQTLIGPGTSFKYRFSVLENLNVEEEKADDKIGKGINKAYNDYCKIFYSDTTNRGKILPPFRNPSTTELIYMNNKLKWLTPGNYYLSIFVKMKYSGLIKKYFDFNLMESDIQGLNELSCEIANANLSSYYNRAEDKGCFFNIYQVSAMEIHKKLDENYVNEEE
jgi:hypothetical protein